MSPRARGIAFVVACVLQMGAAVSGIARYEQTLSQGVKVLIEAAPMDPADPFRGRYVQLGFAATQTPYPLRGPAPEQWGAPGYAVLRNAPNELAQIEYVTAQRPSSGLFLKVELQWPDENQRVNITLPFDRYYMEESLAPAAELAYRDAMSATAAAREKSYAIVRVLDGRSVIEGVVLDGVAIEQAARERRRKP